MFLIFIAGVLVVAGLDDLFGITHDLHPIAGPKVPCHIRLTFRGMLFLLTGFALIASGCRAL